MYVKYTNTYYNTRHTVDIALDVTCRETYLLKRKME